MIFSCSVLTNRFSCIIINRLIYRGVAQLVAREVWDFDAAGSNPVTPTKIRPNLEVLPPLSVSFLSFLGVLPPLLRKSYFLRPHNQMRPAKFSFL